MDKLASRKAHSVHVLCPCSVDLNQNVSSILKGFNLLYKIPDLYFCQGCSSIRCRRCLDFEILSKFCPRCMSHLKSDQISCSKNCFCCPKCNSSLLIKVEDKKDEDGKLKGKVFKFTCPSQHYEYNTGLIDKPKSLSRILKGQSKHQNEELQLFDSLIDYYVTTKEVLKFQEKRSALRNPNRSSPIKIQNNTKFKISSIDLAKLSVNGEIPKFHYHEEHLDHDLLLISKASNVRQFTPSNVPAKDTDQQFPSNQPLQAKYILKCKECNHVILEPDGEPRSSKFSSTNLACDVIPEIKVSCLYGKGQVEISEENDINLLLSFINPTTTELKVSVSSFDKIPMILSDDQNYVKVNIPCSNFDIGARPEKVSKLEVLLSMMPTVELNDNSAISRAELLKRSNVIKRLSTPLLSNTSDRPLDSGINWCTIPLNIKLCGDSNEVSSLKMPFFVSFQSKEYNYGFWIVTDIDLK